MRQSRKKNEDIEKNTDCALDCGFRKKKRKYESAPYSDARVSCAEYCRISSLFRALLQKRPIILKKENMNLLHIAMRLPESQMKKEILLVGSFKLQVSFAKEPYERDHILQKRPKISGRHPYSDACILFSAFPFPSQENTDRVCFIA